MTEQPETHAAPVGTRADLAETDPLYPEAVEFAASRVGFTRDRFQRVMRIGFAKRDALLQELVDNGVIKHASNDRDYFLTSRTPVPLEPHDWPDERWPTSTEWRDWFLRNNAEQQEVIAQAMLISSEQASRCWEQNHERRLRDEIDATRDEATSE